MTARIVLGICLTLSLTACSIRAAETTNPTPADQSNQSAPESTELDKANAFLTEVKVPLSELGPSLRKLGKFDAHLKWSDEFIKETITAASLLKLNDRLEGPMLAKVGDHTAEVDVIIIRVEQDLYSLRIVGSHKPITDEIAKVYD